MGSSVDPHWPVRFGLALSGPSRMTELVRGSPVVPGEWTNWRSRLKERVP